VTNPDMPEPPASLLQICAFLRSAWEHLHQRRRTLFAGGQSFKLDPRSDAIAPKLLTPEEEKKHRIEKSFNRPQTSVPIGIPRYPPPASLSGSQSLPGWPRQRERAWTGQGLLLTLKGPGDAAGHSCPPVIASTCPIPASSLSHPCPTAEQPTTGDPVYAYPGAAFPMTAAGDRTGPFACNPKTRASSIAFLSKTYPSKGTQGRRNSIASDIGGVCNARCSNGNVAGANEENAVLGSRVWPG
jgi:hypothetical protein